MRYLFLLVVIFFCSCFAHGQGAHCHGEAVYYFQDASVPPEYHRSYTIKVTCGTVYFTIDSYGDILLSEEYKIQMSTAYKDFLTKLIALKLKKTASKKDWGCTGGKADGFGIDVSYSENSNKLKLKIEGSVYHCGGVDYGNIKGKISEAKDLFKSMVPDFDLKLASTYK